MKRLQIILCMCCTSFTIAHGQLLELSWLFGAYDSFDQRLPESDCKRDFKHAYEGLMAHEMWAYKMVDAWAKPQTGILTGNIMHTGNFDECLAIDVKQNETRITGQYCSVMVVPTNQDLVQLFTDVFQDTKIGNNENAFADQTRINNLKTSWGICVPTSCTSKDLRDIWNITREYFELGVEVYVDDNYCDYEGKISLSTGAIITMYLTRETICAYFCRVFLGIFGIIVLSSTLYDIIIYQRQQKKESNVFVAFSGYTNGRKLLSTETSDNCLQCLNGLRVISMIWIVLGHRLIIAFDVPHLDVNTLAKAKHEVHYMVLFGVTYAVDTFLLISGFLLSYLFLRNQEKTPNFNIPLFYIHRLLRLTPSLAVVVLVYSTLFLYAGNGPYWFFIYEAFQKTCEKNWWITLLYVQNYVDSDNLCVPHSWYLAVDTQLYILSPLILIPLTKWPKKTIAALVVLTLASMAWVLAQTCILKLGPTIFDNSPESSKMGISTHARASPWLIGIIFGYIMHKLKNSVIKIDKTTMYFMWILTLFGLLAIMFGLKSFATDNYSVVESTFYNTLSRPCWSLGLCWIIFACTKNLGGVINKILSLPVFNILIKMNYNMYLLHFLPMSYFATQGRISTYTTILYECYQFWSDVVATIILAFIWSLAFEAPVIILEKIVFNKDRGKSIQKSEMVSPCTSDVESGQIETNKTLN